MWATTGFVVIVSVIVHGLAATPVMARLDRSRRAEGRTHVGPDEHTPTEPGRRAATEN